MDPRQGETAASRLRLALDLFEPGVAMKRLALRRERPEASAAEIEAALAAWLIERPGAIDGDAPGRRREVPASLL
jgi:hypothetical protein